MLGLHHHKRADTREKGENIICKFSGKVIILVERSLETTAKHIIVALRPLLTHFEAVADGKE